MKTLYTGGTFDLFHYGHMRFLKKCRELSDRVVVALNTDSFVLEFKKKAPVLNYEERFESLSHCPYVDEIVPNLSGADSKPTILQVNPNIIAIGDDWDEASYFPQMQFDQDWLDKWGISLEFLPYTSEISASEIRKRLNESLLIDR